jgi:xylulose-5-phosphate/fructose-6-phosphate phosphoketolase
LQNVDAYGRAANYLFVGQIYLKANPLLEVPLKPIGLRLPGH